MKRPELRLKCIRTVSILQVPRDGNLPPPSSCGRKSEPPTSLGSEGQFSPQCCLIKLLMLVFYFIRKIKSFKACLLNKMAWKCLSLDLSGCPLFFLFLKMMMMIVVVVIISSNSNSSLKKLLEPFENEFRHNVPFCSMFVLQYSTIF